MKFVCIILLYIFVLISCNTRRQALKKILKEWTNREIIFPNLETKYMGKDTILPNMLNH